MTTYTDTMIEAFIAEFPNNAPWSTSHAKENGSKPRRQKGVERNLNTHFSIHVGGHEIVLNAHVVYMGWRAHWHKVGERYSTTDEQKQRIRVGLKEYWKDPWQQAKPSARARMTAQITWFIRNFAARKPMAELDGSRQKRASRARKASCRRCI